MISYTLRVFSLSDHGMTNAMMHGSACCTNRPLSGCGANVLISGISLGVSLA